MGQRRHDRHDLAPLGQTGLGCFEGGRHFGRLAVDRVGVGGPLFPGGEVELALAPAHQLEDGFEGSLGAGDGEAADPPVLEPEAALSVATGHVELAALTGIGQEGQRFRQSDRL